VTKKTRWYIMSVLAYYRSEWTDVPDEDKDYRLLVTSELERLIKACMRRGVNVPNAAKEVEIFMDLQEAKAGSDINSSLDYLTDIKSKPVEPDDESEA